MKIDVYHGQVSWNSWIVYPIRRGWEFKVQSIFIGIYIAITMIGLMAINHIPCCDRVGGYSLLAGS
jgi:hypothetical protein